MSTFFWICHLPQKKKELVDNAKSQEQGQFGTISGVRKGIRLENLWGTSVRYRQVFLEVVQNPSWRQNCRKENLRLAKRYLAGAVSGIPILLVSDVTSTLLVLERWLAEKVREVAYFRNLHHSVLAAEIAVREQ